MQKGIIVHTVILNDQGEFLILLRSKKSTMFPERWDIPGGTLEDGEDPAVGAIREIKEETGLDIVDPKLFFVKSNIDTSKNKQFVTLIFHAKSSNTEVTINPIEHNEYAWVAPSKIDTYKTVDYLPSCLRAYREFEQSPI